MSDRTPPATPADLSRIAPSVASPGRIDDHFAINTSTRCQHRCAYCFEGERGGLRDVPADEVRDLLRQAARHVRAVVYMGAEATLRPDFVDLVAAGSALGLEMRVSTNGLRFADRRFLDAAIDAGLKAVELSFPYPDRDTYLALTGAKDAGFRMLLAALDNLRADGRVRCNINVVVSRFNHGRVGEAIALAAAHLGPALSMVTLKRCVERDPAHVVPADALREALVPVLAGWRHPFPAIHRGFPMCAVPGFEHLDGDLVYVRQGVPVLDNFQRQDTFVAMYGPLAEAARHPPPGCAGCALADVCFSRRVFAERPDDPRNRPRPSARDPRAVLVANGTAPDAIDATLAGLRAARDLASGGLPADRPDLHAALAARMGLCARSVRLAGVRPDPAGGAWVDLASVDGAARARLRLDGLDDPGPGTLAELAIDDAACEATLRDFVDAVAGWTLPGGGIGDPRALADRLAGDEAGAPDDAVRTLAVAGDRVAGWRPGDRAAVIVRVRPAGDADAAADALFCGRFLLAIEAGADTPPVRAWLARIAEALDAMAGPAEPAWPGPLWRAFGPRLWPGAKRGAALRSVAIPRDGDGGLSVVATFDLGDGAGVAVTLRPGTDAGPAFARTAVAAMAYRADGIDPSDPRLRALLDAVAKRLPR